MSAKELAELLIEEQKAKVVVIAAKAALSTAHREEQRARAVYRRLSIRVMQEEKLASAETIHEARNLVYTLMKGKGEGRIQ